MKPTEIAGLVSTADPIVTGRRILCRLSCPDIDADSYRAQYFARALPEPATASGAGSAEPATASGTGADTNWQRVTHGWSDAELSVSARHRGLIRSTGAGQSAQLWVAPSGAEFRQVTDAPLGVSAFALDPAGERAVFIARVPETGRYGTDETIGSDAEAPRHITSAVYLADGLGYSTDRVAQLFSVEFGDPKLNPTGVLGSDEVPEAVALTAHTQDVSDPQFSPGGRLSVIAGVDQPSQDVDLRSHLWLIGDEEMERIELGMVSAQLHVWLDEHRIAFIGIEHRSSVIDFVAALPGLFVHDLRSGQTTRLTCADTVELESIRPVIGEDCAYVVLTRDGSQTLARIPLPAHHTSDDAGSSQPPAPVDAAGLELLTPPELVVTGVAAADDALIVTAATPESAGEVFAVRGGQPPVALSDFAATHAPVQLSPRIPQPLRAATPLGEVHGWVAVPEGDGPFPVILNIHGGPFSQYTEALFDETQVLVGAGYACVYANPRGSNGRGRAWGAAVQQNLAAPAMADVLAILDAALEAHPKLDRTRLGVQGGSYGGYLTAMILNAETRFRAGIVERGYLDPVGFVGTSDIGRFFTEEYTGRDPEQIAAQSPMHHLADNSTPTLIIHSERDFRCPLEQAQRYYAGLQRAGTHAELLIFPGESHGLSRTGRPRHRVQRFEHMLAWWSSHLRT